MLEYLDTVKNPKFIIITAIYRLPIEPISTALYENGLILAWAITKFINWQIEIRRHLTFCTFGTSYSELYSVHIP